MTPAARERIRAQLAIDEELRLKPYVDSVGKVTIGYGRNLTDNGISEAEAYALRENDIGEAERGLLHDYPWMQLMKEPRFAALVMMRFNMGGPRFAGFQRMLSALATRDFERAAAEALDSKWAEQVGDRALRIAQMIRTGEWV